MRLPKGLICDYLRYEFMWGIIGISHVQSRFNHHIFSRENSWFMITLCHDKNIAGTTTCEELSHLLSKVYKALAVYLKPIISFEEFAVISPAAVTIS